jgi:hypothetical protein
VSKSTLDLGLKKGRSRVSLLNKIFLFTLYFCFLLSLCDSQPVTGNSYLTTTGTSSVTSSTIITDTSGSGSGICTYDYTMTISFSGTPNASNRPLCYLNLGDVVGPVMFTTSTDSISGTLQWPCGTTAITMTINQVGTSSSTLWCWSMLSLSYSSQLTTNINVQQVDSVFIGNGNGIPVNINQVANSTLFSSYVPITNGLEPVAVLIYDIAPDVGAALPVYQYDAIGLNSNGTYNGTLTIPVQIVKQMSVSTVNTPNCQDLISPGPSDIYCTEYIASAANTQSAYINIQQFSVPSYVDLNFNMDVTIPVNPSGAAEYGRWTWIKVLLSVYVSNISAFVPVKEVFFYPQTSYDQLFSVEIQASPILSVYEVSVGYVCGDINYSCGGTGAVPTISNIQLGWNVDMSSDTPVAQVNDTSFIASGETVSYTQVGPAWSGCAQGDPFCDGAINALAALTKQNNPLFSPAGLFVQNARDALNGYNNGSLTTPFEIPLAVVNPNNTVINVTTPFSDAPNYYLASYIGGPAEQYYIPYDSANPPDTISIKKEDLDLYLQKIKNLSDENDRLRSLERIPKF